MIPSTAPGNAGFVYEFDRYRYWVRNDWQLALDHATDGGIVGGAIRRSLHESAAC